jgi:predicted MFS family arabinose efflux permease
MVVGGLLALRWQPRHALRWGTALGVTWALPLLALGVSPTWATVAAAMFVSGVALEQFGIAWDVSLQQHVPPDRLARVYSYDAVGSFVAIPLGEVAVGPLAGRLGVEPTLVTCAAVVLVAVGAALCSPGVRSLTRVDVPAG